MVEALWKSDIESKSSTKYLNPFMLNVVSSHHIWSTVRDNIHDMAHICYGKIGLPSTNTL